MKKLIILLLSMVLVFGTVAMLAGCDEGTIGPQGPAGPQGEQGIQGPAGPQGESGVLPERIFQLGETFTYVNHGLRLFSVRLERNTISPTGFMLYITNHNMPGLAPNDFISGRAFNGTSFANAEISFTVIAIGDTQRSTLGGGGVVTSATCIWFGTPSPTSDRAMIPFVRFNVSP